jgi:glycosyltransferase involved in cell wall biosynthesis
MPKVSVLMAVYNGAQYLRPALESLLAQTFEDFELVIVDDASTDCTPEILAEYGAQDARVRLLRNSSNLTLPASLNRGLKVCKASLVARADADDIYERDRLRKQVDFMEQNPEVGLISSNVHVIDEGGEYLRTSDLPLSHEAMRLRMNYSCPVSHPAVMFRRNMVLEAGGYDEEAVTSQDVELWSRLVHRTRFANLAEPLIKYRRHGESNYATRCERGEMVSLRARRELLEDYLDEPVGLEEAGALHALLRRRSAKHSQAEVERGLKVAKQIWEKLYRRGLNSLRREFEQELFDAICSQSVKHSASDRSFGWHLLREAVRISPRQMGRLQGLKKIAAMIRG